MRPVAREARANRVSAALLFATLALAPLPFGSTDPVVIAVWCIVLGVAVAAANPGGLQRGHLALLALAGLLVVLYGVVVAQQLSSHLFLPGASPDPLWREAAEALGLNLPATVSIARNEPLLSLGAPLAAMLALICGLIVCADRQRARQLLTILAWSGVAYAAFGILSFLIDPTKILWRDKRAYLNALTGTFTNRNTAAVYFGTCAIVWLLLLCERANAYLAKLDASGWKQGVRNLVFAAPRPVVLAFCMLLVCLIALLMTGSRAGIVLSLVVLVMTGVVFLQRRAAHRVGMLGTVAIGAVMALAVLQFLAVGVGGRFDLQGFDDEGRLETYRATWRMIMDHPWFGTGLGTFAWGFPAYRSDGMTLWGVWDRAHNTLLELAADVGIPLAAAVVIGWLVVLAVLIRGVRIRRRDFDIPLAALAVSLLALIHSLVDFSLQIPGFSLVVFALVGAGLAQSFRSGRRS